MLFLENIFLALSGLKANKMRSLLTMLGIIIGISSVIAIMSIGDALTRSTVEALSDLGASEITLGIQQRSEGDADQQESEYTFNMATDSELKDEDKLDTDEIQDIWDTFSDRLVAMRLENTVGDAVMMRKGKETKLSVYGENNDGLTAKKLKMVAGRCFTAKDQREARKVAVISDKAVDSALKMPYEEVPGQQITVVKDGEFHHFTVVGVYHFNENDLQYAFGKTDITNLYLPASTSYIEWNNKELYSSVTLTFAEGVDSSELMKDIEEYVNTRYYRNNESFYAKTFSNASLIQQFEEEMQMMSLGVAVIAAISLLVGGIGVMNIMLVSIQERTREIGTRKALGATNSSIRMQFIVEAIVLCIVGGILGIIIGTGMGYGATVIMSTISSSASSSDEVTEIVFNIPYDGIVMSLIFSAAVGIFFGYYPANKAAKMNPIDALRYE